MRIETGSLVILGILFHEIVAQFSSRREYTLGVYILHEPYTAELNDYKRVLDCLMSQTNDLDKNYTLKYKVATRDEEKLSPKGFLDSMCQDFDHQPVSTALLLLRGKAKTIPIYKYIVNTLSAQEIPVMVWNNHVMTVSGRLLLIISP